MFTDERSFLEFYSSVFYRAESKNGTCPFHTFRNIDLGCLDSTACYMYRSGEITKNIFRHICCNTIFYVLNKIHAYTMEQNNFWMYSRIKLTFSWLIFMRSRRVLGVTYSHFILSQYHAYSDVWIEMIDLLYVFNSCNLHEENNNSCGPICNLPSKFGKSKIPKTIE